MRPTRYQTSPPRIRFWVCLGLLDQARGRFANHLRIQVTPRQAPRTIHRVPARNRLPVSLLSETGSVPSSTLDQQEGWRLHDRAALVRSSVGHHKPNACSGHVITFSKLSQAHRLNRIPAPANARPRYPAPRTQTPKPTSPSFSIRTFRMNIVNNWRRDRDSNPSAACATITFPRCANRPLWHLSPENS